MSHTKRPLSFISLRSYDHRELQAGRPKQTKPDANTTLARRTTFRADTSPAALLIERVDADDGGIYRCRVDYLLSPTQNKKVNLTVIGKSDGNGFFFLF